MTTTSLSTQLRSRLPTILAGGLVGSALRSLVAAQVAWSPGGWPLATLAINLIGAACAAFFLTRRQRVPSPARSVDFWAIGLLASFTTFSALALETVLLLDSGRTIAALGYATCSTILGIGAASAGRAIGIGT